MFILINRARGHVYGKVINVEVAYMKNFSSLFIKAEGNQIFVSEVSNDVWEIRNDISTCSTDNLNGIKVLDHIREIE